MSTANQPSTLSQSTNHHELQTRPETAARGDFLYTIRNPTAHVHNAIVINSIGTILGMTEQQILFASILWTNRSLSTGATTINLFFEVLLDQ